MNGTNIFNYLKKKGGRLTKKFCLQVLLKNNILTTMRNIINQTCNFLVRCIQKHYVCQWNTCVTNDHGYAPLVVNTFLSFSHSRLITGFVTRLTQRVPLVEQKLFTLPEHLSSPPGFSGVRGYSNMIGRFRDRVQNSCSRGLRRSIDKKRVKGYKTIEHLQT